MSSRAMHSTSTLPCVLRFSDADVEARLGLPRGRLTNPSNFSGLLAGSVLVLMVYLAAWIMKGSGGFGATVWRWLTDFQGIPIAIMVLTGWSVALLCLKLLKIRAQRKALEAVVMPSDAQWVLHAASAEEVIRRVGAMVEDADSFMYFKRVLGVLKAMRNLGRVSEVEDLFEARASADEAVLESGYTLVKAFIWGVPVLGFIGTVIGLTQATGKFGVVLRDDRMKQDLNQLTSGLVEVLGGLDTAFVTTGEGLVAALLLFMLMTVVRQTEERLLDDVRDHCYHQVVMRTRLLPRQSEV